VQKKRDRGSRPGQLLPESEGRKQRRTTTLEPSKSREERETSLKNLSRHASDKRLRERVMEEGKELSLKILANPKTFVTNCVGKAELGESRKGRRVNE